jgi:hypothetical protein
VNSRTTAGFRELFARLPEDVQRQARAAYRRFQQNPHHPGLRFRQVHATEPIYSARVGLRYRAVGILVDEGIVWFWIGSHADYDALLAQMS